MNYKKYPGTGSNGKTATTFAAGYVVVNSQKQFLLTKDNNEDFWKFPGGTVEDHEDFRTTAQRELFEEVGLTSEEDRDPIIYAFHKYNEEEKVTYYYILIHFYTLKVKGELKVHDSNILEYKYFDKNSLPENVAPNIKDVIEIILNKI